jgi:hypothetical protein
MCATNGLGMSLDSQRRKVSASMPLRAFGFAVALTVVCAVTSLAVPWSRADTVGGKEAVQPREHFKLNRPGELSKDDANIDYNSIIDGMVRSYIASGDGTAARYRGWRRFNDAPYLSDTHGNRYVNNYANAIAVEAGYGHMEPGIRMPPGAIFAKDSFTYTKEGKLFPGALFVMEKLAEGTSPKTADWRYAMILPDGSYFGDSAGGSAARMEFCHDCHKQVEEFDYLFFVPDGYRQQFTKK